MLQGVLKFTINASLSSQHVDFGKIKVWDKEDIQNKQDPRKGSHFNFMFIFPQRGRGRACQLFKLLANCIMNGDKLTLTMFSISSGN